MITTSAFGGSDSVLRWSSIGLVPVLQNDVVECAVGKGPVDGSLGAIAYTWSRSIIEAEFV